MPTAESRVRYRIPHTTDTGAIRIAIRTRSALLWRRSSSSAASAPILARSVAPLASQPTLGWPRPNEVAVSGASTGASSRFVAGHDKRTRPDAVWSKSGIGLTGTRPPAAREERVAPLASSYQPRKRHLRPGVVFSGEGPTPAREALRGHN